jgi:lysozyme
MEPDWDNALELIIEEEAFIPFPYDDLDGKFPHPRWTGGHLVGTPTIGYGETAEEIVMPFVRSGGLMTEAEGRELLARRIRGFWTETKRHFTVELGPNQAAAVVSMAYNKGANGMKQSAPDLLAAINQRRFADAAELWKTSLIRSAKTGQVLQGLIRRRAKESVLFSTPHPSEAFMALTPEQQEQLLRTTLATNEAVGRLEVAVRDPQNGLQAQIDALKAKVDELLAQP